MKMKIEYHTVHKIFFSILYCISTLFENSCPEQPAPAQTATVKNSMECFSRGILLPTANKIDCHLTAKWFLFSQNALYCQQHNLYQASSEFHQFITSEGYVCIRYEKSLLFWSFICSYITLIIRTLAKNIFR